MNEPSAAKEITTGREGPLQWAAHGAGWVKLFTTGLLPETGIGLDSSDPTEARRQRHSL